MMPLLPAVLASYFVDGDRKSHHVTPYLETIIFIHLFERRWKQEVSGWLQVTMSDTLLRQTSRASVYGS